MIVCICNRLNEKQVDEAIGAGRRCYADVLDFHGHAPRCGQCRSHIEESLGRCDGKAGAERNDELRQSDFHVGAIASI